MLNISAKYYKSLDEMPLYNWIECNKGNIIYVRENIKKGNEKDDSKFWELLNDEYIKRFGLSDQFIQIIELQKQKALVELDYITTGKRIILNDIKRLEAKLVNMLTNKGNDIEIDVVLVYLSKYLGYKIDKFTTSVSEYFTMLNVYLKENGRTDKEE